MLRRTILTSAFAAAAIAPVAADAHVTLQPSSAAAGGFTRLDVRVPNERDDASTESVEVQFPDGFASASYEPVPGWTVKVTKRELATPIETDDGQITEGIDTITWTADSERDAIPPGAFRDFGLSLRIPDQPGGKLTFRSLQTYTSGEIVRWIGADGSDNPAPIVTVTEEATGGEAAAAHEAPAATAAPPAATSDDESGDTLPIIALIVGALGLVAGVAGLVASRRTRALA